MKCFFYCLCQRHPDHTLLSCDDFAPGVGAVSVIWSSSPVWDMNGKFSVDLSSWDAASLNFKNLWKLTRGWALNLDKNTAYAI